MIKRGDKKKNIAKFYGVHVNTVRDWWKLYIKEGTRYLIQHFKTKLKVPRKSHYKKDDKAVDAFLKTPEYPTEH